MEMEHIVHKSLEINIICFFIFIKNGKSIFTHKN